MSISLTPSLLDGSGVKARGVSCVWEVPYISRCWFCPQEGACIEVFTNGVVEAR